MKDEFRKTRDFCLTLKNVSSKVYSVISQDTSTYNDYYKQESLKCLDECEGMVENLENEYNYSEWSRENWPIMIRELLDSVEYRKELQANYNVWVEIALDVHVWDNKDIERLLRGRNDGNPIDVAGKELLVRIYRIMEEYYALIQEFKEEYNLHDDEDIYFHPSFLKYEYEPEEQQGGSISIYRQNNKVSQLFLTPEDYKDFFRDGDNLICADWARKAWKYSQDQKLFFSVGGDRKLLYDEIKRLHPKIAGLECFRHTLNDLYKSTL